MYSDFHLVIILLVYTFYTFFVCISPLKICKTRNITILKKCLIVFHEIFDIYTKTTHLKKVHARTRTHTQTQIYKYIIYHIYLVSYIIYIHTYIYTYNHIYIYTIIYIYIYIYIYFQVSCFCDHLVNKCSLLQEYSYVGMTGFIFIDWQTSGNIKYFFQSLLLNICSRSLLS